MVVEGCPDGARHVVFILFYSLREQTSQEPVHATLEQSWQKVFMNNQFLHSNDSNSG